MTDPLATARIGDLVDYVVPADACEMPTDRDDWVCDRAPHDTGQHVALIETLDDDYRVVAVWGGA